jgi:hypothetical protein
LRRDNRVATLLKTFEGQNSGDTSFLENLHMLISKFFVSTQKIHTVFISGCFNLIGCPFLIFKKVDEAQSLYDELFFDTSLEVGKTLSKGERDLKGLTHEKVVSFLFCSVFVYRC